MKECIYCHGGHLKETLVDFDFWWGERLVLLKGVPALVCEDCGEKYFRPEVSEKMKALAKDAAQHESKYEKINVPVVPFGETVAA
ncbi:MAG: type II toxin-antitoxin system MqsA family antitoxin [Nitrospirae bacterium]|nr:type II toxin-antitoxin system MqsA family antitoxin [Nitrospirota bacterium]